MEFVFIYGRMKRGMWDHIHLKRASFLGEGITVNKFKMLVTPNNTIPLIYPSSSNADRECLPVFGEVFLVTPSILEDIEWMEGYQEHHSFCVKDRVSVRFLDNSIIKNVLLFRVGSSYKQSTYLDKIQPTFLQPKLPKISKCFCYKE